MLDQGAKARWWVRTYRDVGIDAIHRCETGVRCGAFMPACPEMNDWVWVVSKRRREGVCCVTGSWEAGGEGKGAGEAVRTVVSSESCFTSISRGTGMGMDTT